MKRYGLVFKIVDQCWLAEYVNGTVEDACPIDDQNGVYEDLNPREMSLVEIVPEEEDDRVTLQDLKTITVRCDDFPEKTLFDVVEGGGLPAVAEEVFRSEILEE